MNETYDDLFHASTKQEKPAPAQESARLSPEEWAAKKKQNREAAYALIDQGAEGIVMSPPKMEQYFCFHRPEQRVRHRTEDTDFTI